LKSICGFIPFPLAAKTKSPLTFRVSGPEFDECWAISEMHPRRRAVRVMMMAVVAMIQHDNVNRLWHADERVNGHRHRPAPFFSIDPIQILHAMRRMSS
jgi:hypothetical protein